MDRFADVEKFSRRFLRGHAGAFDYIDICFRAPVADRRFVRVHFHDRVVHAHRRQRRQHMLDCVNAHRSFTDRGSTLDHFEIVDLGIDRRFIRQILALEFDPVISRRRMQLQRNFFARVERCPAEAGGFR